MSGFEAGTDLGTQTYVIRRADLVRYAGASGDFNPIHWSDRVARSVGLPGVIAHGMLTMALAGRALTAWAGEGRACWSTACASPSPVVGARRRRRRRLWVRGGVSRQSTTDGRAST